MPMDLSLYPNNWKQLSHAVKQRTGWRCEECDRLCRKPGERVADLALRLYEDSPDSDFSEVFDHPQRWCLTTAHLDHQPSNNALTNLRALCAPCHCRYDNQPRHRATRRRLKRERQGQMSLFVDDACLPC